MGSRRGSAAFSAWSCASLLALCAFWACQGKEFNGSTGEDPEPQAGGGNEGGSDSNGQGGGSAGSTTQPQAGTGSDQAGSGGEGGATSSCSDNSDCRSGRFCNEGRCAACDNLGDLSTLAYGEPQPLELLNASVNLDALRFARPTGFGAGMVYVRNFLGGHLWLTSDPSKSTGTLLAAPENSLESGALRVVFPLPAPLADFDFFFDRKLEATTKLYGAKLDAQGVVSGITVLPAPFNRDGVTAAYSIALAKERAIWTENIDGSLNIHLRTLALPPGQAEPAELRLPLPFDCGFAGELEYAPWLSPDGRVLLFTARALDEDCQPLADSPTQLYLLGLSTLGEPIGPARVLSGLGIETSRLTDPALSNDGCHLYYSRQDGAGKMGIYRAERLK